MPGGRRGPRRGARTAGKAAGRHSGRVPYRRRDDIALTTAAWALGGIGVYVGAFVVASTVLMMPVMPFETVPGSDLHGLRIAASKTAWGILSAAGVLILARAVFGEVRGPGLADTAAALAGAVIAGGVQFSLYRWLVERQGFYGELGLLYRWINEPALIVAASTSLFAIAVRPRDSTPPRVALALSVIAGIALALTNLPGARDGISLVGLWLAAAVSLATLYFVVAAAWAIKGQSAPS